jgi:hypothetical protein
MRKIAFTFIFIIFFGIIIFYLIIDKKGGFNKKTIEIRNEAEEYCIFKNGQMRDINGTKFCVTDGSQEFIDQFFIESINEGVKSQEIFIQKN